MKLARDFTEFLAIAWAGLLCRMDEMWGKVLRVCVCVCERRLAVQGIHLRIWEDVGSAESFYLVSYLLCKLILNPLPGKSEKIRSKSIDPNGEMGACDAGWGLLMNFHGTHSLANKWRRTAAN